MRVVFHEAFHGSDYSEVEFDNAADPGRLIGIMDNLRQEGGYQVVTPESATRADLLRGHSREHVAAVEASPKLFAMASLAVCVASLLPYAPFRFPLRQAFPSAWILGLKFILCEATTIVRIHESNNQAILPRLWRFVTAGACDRSIGVLEYENHALV
jgi:hypothetical protein